MSFANWFQTRNETPALQPLSAVTYFVPGTVPFIAPKRQMGPDRSQGAALGWVCSSRVGAEDEMGEKGEQWKAAPGCSPCWSCGYSGLLSQVFHFTCILVIFQAQLL